MVTGGNGFMHDCGTSRAIGWFLEPLAVIALFGKKVGLHINGAAAILTARLSFILSTSVINVLAEYIFHQAKACPSAICCTYLRMCPVPSFAVGLGVYILNTLHSLMKPQPWSGTWFHYI